MDEARDKLPPAKVWLESLTDDQKAELAAKLNDWARRRNPIMQLIADGKIKFHRGVICSTGPIDKTYAERFGEVFSDQHDAV